MEMEIKEEVRAISGSKKKKKKIKNREIKIRKTSFYN